MKNYHGIIVHQRLTVLSRMVLLSERFAELKDGTFAVLLQSGLDEKLWADSMECHCYLRNVQDLLSDGKTPCEQRFGEPLSGPIILSIIHQFSKKVQLIIFPGYVWYAGAFGKSGLMDITLAWSWRSAGCTSVAVTRGCSACDAC